MDTNQNTANNYQINTFTKGMNSDTSYDMIGADQYLFGLNIRITNNTLIFGSQHQNTTEGTVTPIYTGIENPTNPVINTQYGPLATLIKGTKIEAALSIGNTGALITVDYESALFPIMYVYKVIYNSSEQSIALIQWLEHHYDNTMTSISAVMHEESSDVLNLYISDGVHPVITLNLYDLPTSNDIDCLISNRLLPTDRIKIYKSQGRLKTLQVQYSYRLYKKHGTTTKLSPLSPKLLVIDPNRNKELGNAEDTRTSIGLQLKINLTVNWRVNYDYIQIYRISYIKPNAVPEVYLIYDDKFIGNSITFTDKGDEELQRLSIDEFYAMSGEIIIPQSIEQNQGYLFAGNVKDTTIIQFDSNELDIISGNGAIPVYVDVPIENVENAETGLDGVFRNQPAFSDDTLLNPKNIGEYFSSLGIPTTLQDGNGHSDPNGCTDASVSYNDMFGSSLLRSLRRGENYRYGVVYYDKYGAKSKVHKISTELTVPDSADICVKGSVDGLSEELQTIYAISVGGRFTIKRPSEDIVGFLIVRCAKTDEYTKNILQVALSRPSRLGKYKLDDYRTPYYPNVYLSTLFLYITYMDTYPAGSVDWDSCDGDDLWKIYWDKAATNVENMTLYQLFAPEINIVRRDTLSKLKTSDIKISPIAFRYESYGNDILNIARRFQTEESLDPGNEVSHLQARNSLPSGNSNSLESPNSVNLHPVSSGVFIAIKALQQYALSKKSETCVEIKLFDKKDLTGTESTGEKQNVSVKNVEDVKNPSWSSGFSNIQLSGDEVKMAIKLYKSYITNVGTESFVNWVANGLYNLAVSSDDASSTPGQNGDVRVFYNKSASGTFTDNQFLRGWIGPGPVCLIANTEDPATNSILKKLVYSGNDQSGNMLFGTVVANIQHLKLDYNDIYTPYYGFGNFFQFDDDTYELGNLGEQIKYKICYVMDGDVYITPAEFTNMFKTYDFNDYVTSLISGQVVYYIPMESRINTFFDYGMNYRNTSSTNLMLEPGEITGIASLARPLHLYNMVYSDNNTSVDIFSPYIENESVENQYPQRIHYSQLKTNGENIDSWQIFKPVDFIDVDSQYGEITHLLTSDNTLYYWLNKAFGKLSVNERSIIKDENSNAILLGTGGVLNRHDYLSTRYGMRLYDRAAITAEHNIYWIDVDNRAIPAFTGNGVVNYSELCNVQNIVNEKMTDDVPTIYYDLQNYELLCGIYKNRQQVELEQSESEEQLAEPSYVENFEQLVFNLKLNCATAIYTRDYHRCIDINNTLYSLKLGSNLIYRKLNYLANSEEKELLSPIKLSFVVNPQASLTKVYDTQKIVIMDNVTETGRNKFPDKVLNHDYRNIDYPFLTNKSWRFTTDYQSSEYSPNAYRDTENNIWYAIPRTTNSDYGDRIRGKWLKTDIVDTDPKLYAISHIITKFRQSYS